MFFLDVIFPLKRPMLSENEHRNCRTGTIQTAAAIELIVKSRNVEARRLICHGRVVSRLGSLNDL